jgi:hypothetical protein
VPDLAAQRVPKEYAQVSYIDRYLLWVSIYSFLSTRRNTSRVVLTQHDLVGFVYDVRRLSFQNKRKRNPIGTSCIWIMERTT